MNEKNIFRRFVSVFLTGAMLVGLLPASIFATEEERQHSPRFEVKRADEKVYTGRSTDELEKAYQIIRDENGDIEHLAFGQDNLPSTEELAHLIGEEKLLRDETKANVHMYRILRENYGFTEAQVTAGIEQHGGANEFLDSLKRFRTMRELYELSEAVEDALLNLVVAGFSTSEAVTAVICSYTFDISISDIVASKQQMLAKEEVQKPNDDDTMDKAFEVRDILTSTALHNISEQLGEQIAKQVSKSETVEHEDLEKLYNETKEKLFSRKNDTNKRASINSSATMSLSTADDDGYAPAEVIGEIYTYSENGNISVATNNGDYTYTETDLLIPGVNGLDLSLERQFASVTANTSQAYGKFNTGYDGQMAYVVQYEAFEYIGYAGLLRPVGGEMDQPSYRGPYDMEDYTFDAELYDELWEAEAAFYADDYNEAIAYLKELDYYLIDAEDSNGDVVILIFKPALKGIDPVFEDACDNRISKYSYIERLYNLGAGWRFNFPVIEKYCSGGFRGEYGVDDGGKTYEHRLILPDGSRYRIDMDYGPVSNLEGYPFEDMILKQSSSGKYRLEYQDGRTIYFNNDGMMESMEDAFGNEITIEYSGDTDFTITDTVGNEITYTNVPVANDQYYEEQISDEWLYNVQNVLKINGDTIQTYYSYYDEENDVQYLRFVVDAVGKATQYNSQEKSVYFNSFTSSFDSDSNDGRNYVVRLEDINYPDGTSIHLSFKKYDRCLGAAGRTQYYALSHIENYDVNNEEYYRDTRYFYGDLDGYFNPLEEYKTVIQEYYTVEVDGDFYELEKTGQVWIFDSANRCVDELVFCYQPLQYDEDFHSATDIDNWVDNNYCYEQQWRSYTYTDEQVYPSTIETVLYNENEDGASSIEKFYYNEFGQLIEHRKPNGEWVSYTYDDSYGLLISSVYYQDDETEVLIENTLTDDESKVAMTETYVDGIRKSKVSYYYDLYGNLVEQRNYSASSDYSETHFSYQNNAWLSEQKTFDVTDADGYLVAGTPGYSAGTIAERTTYNNRGWPLNSTDANGNTTSYSYNALGQVTCVQYPDGSQQYFAYNTEDRTVTVTDQLGTVTRNTYDSSGNLREVYDVTNGKVLQRDDYAYGRLVESTLYGADSPNQTQYYYYDTLDRVIETGYLNTSGNSIYSERTEYYDGDYKVTKILVGDSHAPTREESFYYDEMNNLVETEILYDEDEDNYEYNQYSYDYLGNRVIEVLWYSAEGGISDENLYEYDYAGNVTEYKDADENVTDYEYDWRGNLIIINDPYGYETLYTYDTLDRLIKVEQPFAEDDDTIYYAVTEYEYDPNGNLIVERVRNEVPGDSTSTRVTEYEYDSMNRLVTAITYDPDPNYTQYRYDDAGNLLEVYTGLSSKLSFSAYGTPSGSDMNYSVTSYEYDNRSNMIEMTDALGQSETYDYDKNGTLTSKTDRNGNTTEYTYNAMGQPTYVDVFDANGLLTDTLSYTYTDNGLVRRIRTDNYTTYYDYDVFGRVIEEDTGDTVIYNTYSLLGDRTCREVYQDDECISETYYEYDRNGRLTYVEDGGYVAAYSYDSLGNCTEACYDDYVYENRTYNLAGYPESITHKRNTRTLSSFDYVYSVDGNMVEKHDDEGRSTYYTYDGMNRLIEEVEELDGDVVQTYEYAFDDFSNRTELIASGDEDYTVNYWYDANNRLLESEKDDGYTETVTEYSYDDNGNQVEKEVWIDNSFDSSETSVYNGFNQLVSVSNDDVDAEYTYAPSGLRLTKTVDNEQIYYINDGDDVIAELYDDEVTAYYLRGRNLYGSFIGNDEYFYLYNAHGDVVNLTDTSGYIEHTYRYDAFGNEREPESSDNNPFRYCGEYYDGETGSYYLQARYYDPVVGRFAQEDPHWTNLNRIYEDTLNSFKYSQQPQITAIMQSGNLYAYSAGNPVLYYDANGEALCWAVGGIVGFVWEGVAAYTQGGTWEEIAAAAVGGAVSGAIAGAASDVILLSGGAAAPVIIGTMAGFGAVGGAAGELTEQTLYNHLTDNVDQGIDGKQILLESMYGAIDGAAGGMIGVAVGGTTVNPVHGANGKKLPVKQVLATQVKKELQSMGTSIGEDMLTQTIIELSKLPLKPIQRKYQTIFAQ